MRKEKTAMIGSKTLKPGAGVKMEMIGDKTRGRDMRASPANTLKPCPFCGSSNLYIGELDGPLEDGITIYVRCLDCGATIEGEGVNEDEDTRREWAMNDAAARWNRRKEEDAIEGRD